MPKPIVITYEGESKSISKWARELDLSRERVCQLVKRMGGEEAIKYLKTQRKPPLYGSHNPRYITYGGKTKSISVWARDFSISAGHFRFLLKKMGDEEAIKMLSNP